MVTFGGIDRLDLAAGEEPRLLAVVNLSPDSFFAGARYSAGEELAARLAQWSAAGVGYVDVGCESSNPAGADVPPGEQRARLRGFFESARGLGLAVSIDTASADLFEYGLSLGAAMLNDVSGLADPRLRALVRESGCAAVCMHNLFPKRAGGTTAGPRGEDSGSVSTEPTAILPRIRAFFRSRLADLQAEGLDLCRIVLDPGMGFFLGPDPRTSFAALADLPALRREFGLPVMAAVSRKSFLAGEPPAPPDGRFPATIAAELWAARSGVDWIRTHDPLAFLRARSAERSIAAAAGEGAG